MGRSASEIKRYAQDVIDLIVSNNLTGEFSHELSVAETVVEQITMDSKRGQCEYLEDEYFRHGSFTLPDIKKKLTRLLNKAAKSERLTELEAEVLGSIANSEFHFGQNPVDNPIAKQIVIGASKKRSGAFGTLVRKGFACSEKAIVAEVCWVTAAGMELLSRLNPVSNTVTV